MSERLKVQNYKKEILVKVQEYIKNVFEKWRKY